MLMTLGGYNTPNLQTLDWINQWGDEKIWIEKQIQAEGYKPLLSRVLWEVCSQVIFVLNPELAAVTAKAAKLGTPPRCILVKHGVIPQHNMSIINTGSPKYDPLRDGQNPFVWEVTTLTYFAFKWDILEVIWEANRTWTKQERHFGSKDGTAYYK